MAETPQVKVKTNNRALSLKERFWSDHYHQWEQSGLSLAGYARSQGLVAKTFYNWHGKLKQRRLVKAEPASAVFHRVRIKPTEPPLTTITEVTPFRFRLPNGIDCEVTVDFDNVTGFLEKLSRIRQ